MKKICIAAALTLLVSAVFGVDQQWFQKALDFDNAAIVSELKKIEQESALPAAEKYFRLGLCYHLQAEKGAKAAQKAIDCFKKSLAADKNDFFVQAYLGSAYTLLGGESNKLSATQEGYAMIDEVLKKKPDDISLLMIRVGNGVAEKLPYFLFSKRAPIVAKDLQILEQKYKSGELHLDGYMQALYFKMFYHLKFEDIQQATKAQKEMEKLSAEHKYTKLAKKKLAVFEDF